jgi:hypothetical protein
VSQDVPAKPVPQVQLPFALALPCPVQVASLVYWHWGPALPVLQTQDPSGWAMPLPLQVVKSLYSHALPA